MRPIVFSIPQRIIHWVTALLVLYQLLFPGSIERVVDLVREGQTPTSSESTSATVHLVLGFTILGLTLLRLILRFIQGVPAEPAEEPAIFQLLSKIGHWLIYFLLIAMPFTGIWKYYLGGFAGGFLHSGPLKALLWVLIGVHVAAALVHKFYWKTNVMDRMTRGV